MRSLTDMKFMGFLITVIMLYCITEGRLTLENLFWLLVGLGLMANRFIGQMLLTQWRAHAKRK